MVGIPYKPEFFSGFPFTTAKVASITALIFFTFNYLQVLSCDYQRPSSPLPTLLMSVYSFKFPEANETFYPLNEN